jgi:hypothetical protein
MNRAWLRVLWASCSAIGIAAAQNAAPEKEARLRFSNAAAQASARFQAAESVEARLRDRGDALHPGITVLRAQIEAALDEANAALGRNEAGDAGAALTRAEALLERFAQRLGF